MIITKTPFRVSLGGGGSDLSSFYRQHGGCVLSTTIDKYMYISIHPYFESETTVLKYSKTEKVERLSDIDHQIFKCVLSKHNICGAEITSTADIPAGTGLGSSSTFTVGLLHTIYCYQGKYVSKPRLAEEACHIEIDELGAPIGKQDQYAAAIGGLNFIRFNPDDTVSVEPIIMKQETYKTLQNNIVMFYTGDIRSANSILQEQNDNMRQRDKTNNLIKMCDLAHLMKESLQSNDLSAFGDILHESWLLKKTLASGISNYLIDDYYQIAMENGAKGGKLLGAGGGGFLMFYCEQDKQEQLRTALGLKEFSCRFENDGTSVVHIGEKYWD